MTGPRCVRFLALALVFASYGAAVASQRSAAESAARVRFAVQPEIAVADVPRIGVNVGRWRSAGAEQLCRNVIQNPGFEGAIDRVMVAVRRASAAGFVVSEKDLGRPDDFWKGARVEVRTGDSVGWQGIVARSRRVGQGGLPGFSTTQPLPPLRRGDLIVVTRSSDDGPPGGWLIPPSAAKRVVPVAGITPPDSPGARSIALRGAAGQPAEITYRLDTIAERAGKLLPVEGKWRLAFWSRAERESGELRVSFARLASSARRRRVAAASPSAPSRQPSRGTPHGVGSGVDEADTGIGPFVDRRILAGAEWRHTQIDFEPADHEPAGPLELRFLAEGAGGVLLDDVELGRLEDTPGAFRAEVVEALQFLRPGYLRDEQGHERDTLDNRLVHPFARRVVRLGTRPAAGEFHFALPDFLELCHAVQALPWVVIPANLSDRELGDLGRFLKRRSGRDQFGEIVLEFGREPADSARVAVDAPDFRLAAALGDSAFGLVKKGFGSASPIVAALRGPFGDPARALALAASTPHADVLAVTAYFARLLAAGLPASRRLSGLFADDLAAFAELAAGLRARAKELAISEVNLGTTGGTAPAGERDATVAGAAAAAALARRILAMQALGARRQCAYALAGFDTPTDDASGFVRLWGLVRDLGPTKRFRPTGLAVAMLNRAIAGDRHRAEGISDNGAVTFAAYHSGTGWSAAIVSARETPLDVEVVFPPAPAAPLPTRMLRLDAPGPWATNEDSEQVRIVEEPIRAAGNQISVRLPPLGLVVLVQQDASPAESPS